MKGTDLSRRLFIGSTIAATTGLAGCTDFGGQGDGQSEEDGEDGGEQGSQEEEEEEGEDEEDD